MLLNMMSYEFSYKNTLISDLSCCCTNALHYKDIYSEYCKGNKVWRSWWCDWKKGDVAFNCYQSETPVTWRRSCNFTFIYPHSWKSTSVVKCNSNLRRWKSHYFFFINMAFIKTVLRLPLIFGFDSSGFWLLRNTPFCNTVRTFFIFSCNTRRQFHYVNHNISIWCNI